MCFIDLAGRVDTSRVGQFFGLIGLVTISVWAAYHITFYNVENPISSDKSRMILLSIMTNLPLLLYRIKGFAGTAGSYFELFEKDERDQINFFKSESNSLWRNMIDQYGRVDTGRLGNIFGLVNMIYLTAIGTYGLLWNKPLDIELLGIVAVDSGVPMLLYRLKEFSGTFRKKKERVEKEIIDSRNADLEKEYG